MHKLSFTIILVLIAFYVQAQSPHGKDFRIDCVQCHTSSSWSVNRSNMQFNHDNTSFKLIGQHKSVNCKDCHTSLDFKDKRQSCTECHTDMHKNTLGKDCARCHTPNSWIIKNTSEIHQQSRFPLLGAHRTANCSDCHKSSSNLQFEPIGIECIDCHQKNFQSTTSPNHILGGISTNCIECHNSGSSSWSTKAFDHSSFPLVAGHAVQCIQCHVTGKFDKLPVECINCHQVQYNNAPKHKQLTYPTDCSKCHATNNWLESSFNHSNTNYPLTGLHKTVECEKCHTISLTGTSNVCNSCHRKNFAAAQVPIHTTAGIPNDCATCHTPAGWKPSTFNHTATGFELKGGHKALVQCSDCHKGSLTTAKPECITCHQVQYDNAPKHKQSAYPANCTMCHSQNNWLQTTFNHATSNFPLTGAHTTTLCSSCHTSVFAGTPIVCSSCHAKNYAAAQVPVHATAGIPNDCATCHTATTWKPSTFNHTTTGFELKGTHKGLAQCSDCHKGNLTAAQPECISCHKVQYDNAPSHKTSGYSTNCIQCHGAGSVSWSDAQIDHSFFPLTSGHAISCVQCHVSGTYGKIPAECNSCHQKNFTAAQVPTHVAAGIPNNCATCHTATTWKPSTFNHTTTGFELKGTHKSLAQCSDCHKGNLTAAQPECISCHKVQYDNAPSHKTSGYSTNCIQCHGAGSVSWSGAQIDHSFFPLTSGHAIGCVQCHVSGTYGKIPAECNSCHQKNFAAAQLPSHVAAGIPNDCATCHTATTWKPSTFNHITTGFELKGTHKGLAQCSDCHKGNLTAAQPECISCHKVQYDNAPSHKTSGYSTNCIQCHGAGSVSWSGAQIDHSFFPLTSGHAIGCVQCHVSGTYGKIPAECNSCHQKNYTAAQVPSHVAAGIPNDCATCHNSTAWKPSLFNHITTGFELKGGHKTLVQCSACHKGNLTSAKPECITCHQVQYDNAPSHKQSAYPTDCTMCHTPNNWLQSSFNHATTNFPLSGAHTTVVCSSCHTSGFAGTPTECNSCHQKNFAAAQLPSHVAAGIPNDCATCHNTTGWKPSLFKHITTGFELKGAHSTLIQCSDCHKGNLTAAQPECISCHQVQYDNAPKHKVSGYPTNCLMCHTPNNWLENSFNHATTSFPLTGAHTTVICASCHTSGFAGTPTVCNSCHQKNFTAAQLPGHVAAGIPNNCATCHTTNGWKPSTFNHITTGFELKGGHKNVIQCSSCHKGNLTAATQECISCHQVQYDNAPKHKVSGYPTTCLMCHTQNNWLENSFNHATTNFPLTGAHTTVLCVACHTSGFTGTPTSCNSCHISSYNKTTNPNHLSAKFPTNCESCHSTKSWSPSTFNHDAQYFPIYSGKHRGKWSLCSECHTNAGNYATFSCILCHEHSNKTSVDKDHSGVKGYSYASSACYSCHPTGSH